MVEYDLLLLVMNIKVIIKLIIIIIEEWEYIYFVDEVYCYIDMLLIIKISN